MKAFSRFVSFLIHLLVLLFGIVLLEEFLVLVASSNDQVITHFSEILKNNPLKHISYSYILGFSGIVFIVLPVFSLFLKMNSLTKKVCRISFKSPNGTVTISNNAITDFVDRICKNYEEVSHSSTKVFPGCKKDKGVIVHIDMDILGGTNIPQIIEQLQQNIKRQINELLGIENVGSIEINVLKIIPPKEAKEQITEGI
jgi:uncharacterized alkaline shock family protein YloU